MLKALVLGMALVMQPVTMPTCGERTTIVGELKRAFNETVHSGGITKNGALLEFLASPNGATWTILISLPGGHTCFVEHGEDWYKMRNTILPPKV